MSLKLLRAEIGPMIGLGVIANSNQQTYLDSRINRAAEELYNSYDLVGCLREQILNIDPRTQQISLGHDVDVVRGLRYFYPRRAMTQNDMRPRYQTQCWGKIFLNWRDKGTSPLEIDIDNESILKFSIPIAEFEDVVITVVGKTPNSERVEEIVTIPVGSLTVNTVNNFLQNGVESIQKNRVSSYNVAIKDADDTVLGFIPNHALFSEHRIFQVIDNNTISVAGSLSNNYVEVLYKKKFVPFSNSGDEFPCPGYDSAIKWKALEHYYAEQQNNETALAGAVAAHKKCDEIIYNMARNNEQGKQIIMDFGENRFNNLIENSLYSSENESIYRQC